MIFEQMEETPPASQIQEDPEETREALDYVRAAANKDDPHLHAMRGAAYTNILFTHGLQHHAYSVSRGRVEDVRDEDEEGHSVTMNVILSITEGQQGYLMKSPSEVVGKATTTDDRDIEAADYATDFTKWAKVKHDLPDVREQAAGWFVETGGVFLSALWDPAAGRMFMDENGDQVFEGEPLVKAESLFAWTLHPEAISVEESEYAHHAAMVHRSWLEEHYPEVMSDLGPTDESTGGLAHDGGLVFENALKNMGPSHGYFAGANTDQDNYPKGEGYYEVQTVYVRSSPKYPAGRMIVALAHNGHAVRILADQENPYVDWSTGRRTLPVIYIPNIRVPGRLLGESTVQHAIPMQQIINKQRKQILDNADLNGNPRGYKSEHIPDDVITDEVGTFIDVPDGATPPGYMAAPELPSYVIQAEQTALQMLEIVSSPNGPLRSDDENITSGIHKMISEEAKAEKVSTMITRWRNGWRKWWGLYIDNVRTFGSTTMKLDVPGDNGSWRQSYFSGELARSNFVLDFKDAEALPGSRTAVFAHWNEVLKNVVGLNQIDPQIGSQMWKDLGRQDIARTYRDNTVHEDKARRNMQRVRMGEMRGADPQDDIETHLRIYKDWMCSAEYEIEAMRDGSFAARMGVLLQSFTDAMNEKMQMDAAMAAMAQDMGEEEEPQRAAGDGGHSRMTQGASQGTPKNSPPRPNARK